ncbi:MAG TPA: bifunctional phosphopantothenoylcysteine decarboxylase/phosphopantothenate--cysteine ligase CoaBC [Beijerinckiaceae bacterium]|jgi:phosphopantothenoylcysteine decarboxylase/phosphopantothenate--cysteine ligase|nr:bifunctional phosphopantothenoylcysteine decarboxylase/phosphopantothenate--cysteine ligase CoaBC [Beijerinckiaceae bacterium]
MLTGKRILLVIGGGIAAYKALDLIRRLRERGASVRAVLTPAAAHFVTPLSVAALSGEKVNEDLFSLTDEAEMGHIELSRDADLLVVVPATADLLAKMANGLANDLASTLLLATDKRTLVAPAMNLRMWLHPATQRNVQRLRDDGVVFIGPVDGSMACGEFGPGRMSEPLEIVAGIEEMLKHSTVIALPNGETANVLRGKHVVITSGPTHEPIDPVRYIANRSSGRQGHAIAAAAAAAGAKVTLISGPVALPDPKDVTTVHVETAQEMLDATRQALPADLFIAAAAVADWRVAQASDNKIKKGKDAPTLTFAENPDILATVSTLKQQRPKLVVGFAAETQNVEDYARQKLIRKKCDMIVANDVSPATGVMGGDENTVHIVTAAGIETWPKMKKDEVAVKLIALLAQRLEAGA